MLIDIPCAAQVVDCDCPRCQRIAHRERTSASEPENISVPRKLLERICGMVYATRGEQHRMAHINDHEYAELVRLRHSGHDSVETVLTALRESK